MFVVTCFFFSLCFVTVTAILCLIFVCISVFLCPLLNTFCLRMFSFPASPLRFSLLLLLAVTAFSCRRISSSVARVLCASYMSRCQVSRYCTLKRRPKGEGEPCCGTRCMIFGGRGMRREGSDFASWKFVGGILGGVDGSFSAFWFLVRLWIRQTVGHRTAPAVDGRLEGGLGGVADRFSSRRHVPMRVM